MWKEGKLKELLSECAVIQKRIVKSKRKAEDVSRGFVRLMMEGKVRQSLKLIDASSDVCGVHEMSDNVRRTLQDKHPVAVDPQAEALDNSEIPRVENIIFEDINVTLVQKSASTTSGSGGPSKVDADVWKNILCSKSYGKYSDELAEQIAVFARRLCTEDIPYTSLESYWAGFSLGAKNGGTGGFPHRKFFRKVPPCPPPFFSEKFQKKIKKAFLMLET